MARLEVSLLGRIQVTLDGEPVTRFRVQAAQALLAYLAMHAGASLRREVLAGLLWPDHPESEALVNLRQALRRLRQAIQDEQATPPFLITARSTIAFNRDADYRLDADAFADAVSVSANHTHPRLEGCHACAERLREAVDLYRGDFLQGFSLDSALFEEWMVVERERLHGQAVEALGHLAAFHEERGEYTQALDDARRQVNLEPWRESAHRQAMRCLALSGQRGAALSQYKACRRVLADELGIEPELETVSLCERIREGALRPAAPGERPEPTPARPASVEVPHHNLPAQLTPFVGREDLLAEIAARLEDPACRLLTLAGPGGSGKTRLALEAAARQLGRYPDGVYLVSLAPLQSVEAILPTVAQAIGYILHAGDAREQLYDYLRRKEMLLVLDNHEHLIEGASVATGILRAATGVRILVTSRAALNVPGEHLLAVSGLAYPARGSEQALQEAASYGAVLLFVHAARRHNAGVDLSADSLPHVARICHLLRGMPLGILLAASWAAMFDPAEIERELTSEAGGLDFLEADLHDVPARQRSMRAVFAYSWGLLGEREQDVLQALSVFRGGFTREAAQAVAGASLRDLMALIRRSLLHRTPAGRFEVHELLRQYASERLSQTLGGTQGGQHGRDALDRHSAYYTAALAGWEADLKGARQQVALAEMDVEIDNLRAAWERATQSDRERKLIHRLDQATEALGLYYEIRVRYEEGEAAFRAAVDRLAQRELGLVHAQALTWQAHFEHHLGRADSARQVLQQSLDLLEHLEPTGQDVRLAKARVLQERGWIECMSGNNNQSRQFSAQSLALCRAVGDRWATAKALRTLGQVTQNLGMYEEARRLHGEALEIRRALGDQRGIAESLEWVAAAVASCGQWAAAEQLLREGAAVSRSLGDPIHLAERLWRLGVVLSSQGEFAESVSVQEEGLELFGDSRSSLYVAHTHSLLGDTKTHLGQYQEARTHLQQGMVLSRARGHLWGIGVTLGGLAAVMLAEEQYADAQRSLEEGIAIFRESGEQSDLGPLFVSLARAAYGLGRMSTAHQHLCAAIQHCIDIRDVPKAECALPMAALLLVDRGEIERAVELYARARLFGRVAHSCWFEDVYGRQIAAAARALPPEVVSAAEERGRERDLWATMDELLATFKGS